MHFTAEQLRQDYRKNIAYLFAGAQSVSGGMEIIAVTMDGPSAPVVRGNRGLRGSTRRGIFAPRIRGTCYIPSLLFSSYCGFSGWSLRTPWADFFMYFW